MEGRDRKPSVSWKKKIVKIVVKENSGEGWGGWTNSHTKDTVNEAIFSLVQLC